MNTESTNQSCPKCGAEIPPEAPQGLCPKCVMSGVATEPGASFRFLFNGVAVGLWVAAGPDAGVIEFSVDGGPYQRQDLFTRWSGRLHLPWAYILADALQPGDHVLDVRVSTHAGDAATYKLIQGVDHFERVRENLQEYDRQRRAANLERVCGLHVHHVIQRENLETIPSMFEFGAAVGADHVVFERVFALSPEFRLTRSELARAAVLLVQGALGLHREWQYRKMIGNKNKNKNKNKRNR